ncbi:cytochrome P450 [Pleomassaria siparia CBS 279.74]|uniref:Cytochrome P450 n=1 Tax=Pleomassaria siparia CBS 279.74 TaxID=1314801 RepID=A0A6G1KGD6_9PLEO|nr:cytochrome P450 [Pleomassaria siparia CBS 279.74]
MALLKLQMLPVSQVLLGGFLALICYLSVLSIYRIFLHPLAKYPGPIQYKLSEWPLLWQAYKGNRHIRHVRDHGKYGSIVRIAPNALSFNTASALNAIYGPRSANVKKGEWYKTFDVAAGSYSSFTETDKDIHAAKRRVLSPAFSVESQKLNEPVIIDMIERFCDTIKPTTDDWDSTSWNITDVATHLGFDIMGGLVLGCDFCSVQEETNRHLADSVLPASKFLYWVSYLPMAVLIRPLLRTKLFEILGGKPVVDNNRLIDYASRQVQLRSQDRKHSEHGSIPDRFDYLSRIVGAQDKKTGWRPTQADLNTETLNLINAGADPYSGSLAALIFYLVHNIGCLQKATVEVRTAFASSNEIYSGSKLNSCVYLYACIEESLRRAAPVPSHMPRVVMSGGMEIDGHLLPEGTVVGVSAYSIHHSPTHFSDPWSFKPERWMESDVVTPEDISHARTAFNPFSLGTRGCIGKSVAYLQLKLTLAHVIYRYDLRVAPEDPKRGCGESSMEQGREREDEFQLWDSFGFGRDGPVVQFRKAQ